VTLNKISSKLNQANLLFEHLKSVALNQGFIRENEEKVKEAEENEENYENIFKILLIGDSGVGKSCLLLRYTDNTFSENFFSTIGVDFKIKDVAVDGEIVKLHIWDTAGQERFKTITSSYYRGSHGIFLVYDITDRVSFKNIKVWVDEIKKFTMGESIMLFLVGNKKDQEESRAVDASEGQDLADQLEAKFLETSAKDRVNVDQIFTEITKSLKQKYIRKINTDKAILKVGETQKIEDDQCWC